MLSQRKSKFLKRAGDILIAASILVIGYFHFKAEGVAHSLGLAHCLMLLILPLMFVVLHWESLFGQSRAKKQEKGDSSG